MPTSWNGFSNTRKRVSDREQGHALLQVFMFGQFATAPVRPRHPELLRCYCLAPQLGQMFCTGVSAHPHDTQTLISLPHVLQNGNGSASSSSSQYGHAQGLLSIP